MSERDTGLRTMMIWTFAALILALLMAFLGVKLVVHFFDRP